MVNYIDKKGKFVSVCIDVWGNNNFSMRVTGRGRGVG